jgi:hypothetical protein
MHLASVSKQIGCSEVCLNYHNHVIEKYASYGRVSPFYHTSLNGEDPADTQGLSFSITTLMIADWDDFTGS